jgi:metallo-beta-lactamase family protein
MDITFHGAAQTVTGSQHLLTINGHKILLDCGLYQGKRQEAAERNSTFKFDPAEVDAVILSHAHIDHSGNLPSLVKKGFRGPIHATHATVDLCDYMLRDSANIQEADAEFLNRRAAKRKQPQDHEPLYTQADAEQTLRHFTDQPFQKPFEVAPGVQATFYEAGHILGAASVVLDVEETGLLGRRFRFAFSGDIGRFDIPILKDPIFLKDIDFAIMESTYGAKNHRPPEEAESEFTMLVKETIARRGKLIIPSFAVGRAQELVYALSKLVRSGAIPPIPVYVDSPLADKASTVFWAHVGHFDSEAQAFVREDETDDVFGFRSLKYVKSAEESKALNALDGPLVIISASGMCESGRIRHHLANNISNPKNTILIVSWQAPDTLGRQIADRLPEVRIFGEPYELRAQVATINGYSGHAGRDLLIDWAEALGPRLKQLFLVHGEPESSTALAQALQERGLENVRAPKMYERVPV